MEYEEVDRPTEAIEQKVDEDKEEALEIAQIGLVIEVQTVGQDPHALEHHHLALAIGQAPSHYHHETRLLLNTRQFLLID